MKGQGPPYLVYRPIVYTLSPAEAAAALSGRFGSCISSRSYRRTYSTPRPRPTFIPRTTVLRPSPTRRVVPRTARVTPSTRSVPRTRTVTVSYNTSGVSALQGV